MKVELTTVKLGGLQICGAKTQCHLTQNDQCKCFFYVWVEWKCLPNSHSKLFSVSIMCSKLHNLV